MNSNRYINPREDEEYTPPITYADFVAALAKPGDNILASLTASEADLWHAVTGVVGEAGELIDAVKKSVIYNKELDRDNIVEELGDLCFYIQMIQNNLGITDSEIMNHNVLKLSKRYVKGYSDKAAQERADKNPNPPPSDVVG